MMAATIDLVVMGAISIAVTALIVVRLVQFFVNAYRAYHSKE